MARKTSDKPSPAEAIIKDLAAHFEKHGRVLSRREYKRIKPSPHSINKIERYIGWGAAKHQASMLLAKGKGGISGNRRSALFIAPDDDDRIALMAGLK